MPKYMKWIRLCITSGVLVCSGFILMFYEQFNVCSYRKSVARISWKVFCWDLISFVFSVVILFGSEDGTETKWELTWALSRAPISFVYLYRFMLCSLSIHFTTCYSVHYVCVRFGTGSFESVLTQNEIFTNIRCELFTWSLKRNAKSLVSPAREKQTWNEIGLEWLLEKQQWNTPSNSVETNINK